ncbi:hypothetical protein DD908_13945, partial [Staphylococcus pseudintermedius]
LKVTLAILISFRLKGKHLSKNNDLELKLNVISINKYIKPLVMIVTFTKLLTNCLARRISSLLLKM